MLEEDYLAFKNRPQSTDHSPQKKIQLTEQDEENINNFSSSIMREIVLPAIEKEVNEGKNFAELRQIYHSLILAVWFKQKLKQGIEHNVGAQFIAPDNHGLDKSLPAGRQEAPYINQAPANEPLLTKIYIDKKKIKGIDTDDPKAKEKVYQLYVQAYKNGLYNYIKSDFDSFERKQIKRRYYSGGADFRQIASSSLEHHPITKAPQLVGSTMETVSTRLLPVEVVSSSVEAKPNKDGLCLTPDSLIYLADGTAKPLIELSATKRGGSASGGKSSTNSSGSEGDMVLSLNEATGRLEPHRVLALLDMGVKPVYRLTTASGKTLKTTLTHPYLTKDGWKKLKDIKVGEEIAVAKGDVLGAQRVKGGEVASLGGAQKARAHIRTDKDRVKSLKLKSGSQDNRIAAGEVIFQDKFIGLGNIIRRYLSNSNLFAQDVFAQPMDNEVKFGGDYSATILNPIEGREKFGYRKAANDNLRFCLPKYFNDGIASNFPMVTFHNGRGVKEIKHSALRFVSHPAYFFGHTSLKFGQSLMDLRQRDVSFGEPFFGDLLSASFNGKARLDEIVNSNFVLGNRHNFASCLKVNTSSYLSQDNLGIAFEPITKIEYLGELSVYDIEVEATHNFIAQGIVAHNTYTGIASSALIKGSEEEAKKFLERVIDIGNLERNFKEIIDLYGYAPFKELYETAGKNAEDLFYYGLPAVKELFKGELKTYWPDLVQLGLAAGKNAGHFFYYGLPAVKELFKGELKTYWPDLVRLGLAAGENAEDLFQYGLPAVKELIKDAASWQTISQGLKRICKNTTEYNREKHLEYVTKKYLPVYKDSSLDIISQALDFYIRILKEEPRLSLQILEGLAEAVVRKEVDKGFPAQEQAKILGFAKLTHSFSPSLYSLYKKEGEDGLEEIFAFDQKIIEGHVGLKEIKALEGTLRQKGVSEKDMLEAVVACIQMTIPSSGASFVKKEEVQGLFGKYREAEEKKGDSRRDVPKELRDREFGSDNRPIELVDYRLKEGTAYDAQGQIGAIVNALRHKDRGISKEEKERKIVEDRVQFKNALLAWFKDYGNKEKKDKALQAFYQWASHNDALGEKIDALSGDYQGLALLESLFIDKDNLSLMIREVLKEIESELLPIVPKETRENISNPPSLKKQIEGLWKSKASDKEHKLQAILSRFSKEEIENKLIPLIMDERLKEIIFTLSEGERRAGHIEIIEELFQEPLTHIQEEKEKFVPVKSGKVQLAFRVVKGLPYSLWGLNAGVCIATDIELWKKEEFWLLAMIDKVSKQVVGFAHLFVAEIEGKKILLVPGIEPSVEFLSQVKVAEIYPLIEQALKEIADTGGYAALYIPTAPNILSNRKDIAERVIKRHQGAKRSLPKAIDWNTLPSPYPISEVFLVWKKDNLASSPLGLCLTPDSLIYLADGSTKPLIELSATKRGGSASGGKSSTNSSGSEGDMVLSLNEATGRLEPHRMLALLDMGVKPVYQITTQSGKSLKTTLTHPYLTRKGWKKLSGVKVGEEIACLIDKQIGLDEDLFRPGSNPVPFNNKKFSFKLSGAAFFKKIESEINNFLFTRIFNIHNHNSRRTPDVKSHNVPKILIKGKQDVVTSKDIIENNIIRGANKVCIVNRDNFKSLVSQGSNDIPINTLVGKDSHKDSLGLRDYLGGMFHKLAGIFNSGKNIFLGNAGILFGNFFNSVASAQQIENIAYRNAGSLNAGFAKPDFGINHNSFMHNLNASSIKDTTLSDSRQGTIFFEPIIKIEYLGELSVYDIEVEATHNFIAQGIVAHNTYSQGSGEEKISSPTDTSEKTPSALKANKGGIDLNPQNLELEISGVGGAAYSGKDAGLISSPVVNVPFDLQNFQGFSFQIISIQPVKEGEAVFS